MGEAEMHNVTAVNLMGPIMFNYFHVLTELLPRRDACRSASAAHESAGCCLPRS